VHQIQFTHSPFLRYKYENTNDSNVTDYWSVKFTVTVMMTGTGTPFSSVGVNVHCLTASGAA
jgi:hypothetical protein